MYWNATTINIQLNYLLPVKVLEKQTYTWVVTRTLLGCLPRQHCVHHKGIWTFKLACDAQTIRQMISNDDVV